MREEIYDEAKKLIEYLSVFAFANNLAGFTLDDKIKINYVANFKDRTITLDLINEKTLKMKIAYSYRNMTRDEIETKRFQFCKEHFGAEVNQFDKLKRTMYFMTTELNCLNAIINYLVEDEL